MSAQPYPASAPDRPSQGRGVAFTTAALAAGRAVALLAGIATVALASHYLGLRRFGALSAGMAFASLFALLTDLGLSTVATREIARSPHHEDLLLGHVLRIGLVLAVVSAALGVASMEIAYPGMESGPTRTAILILLSQTLVAPVTGASRAFLTARRSGYLIAVGDITLAIAMAAFTAVAVVARWSFDAIVIAIACGYLAQAVAMAAVSLRAGARPRVRTSGGAWMIRLALPLAGTLLLNYLYFRLDILLLSWLRTDADVARYSLAYRVLEGLMVLPSYLMLALFPAIARSEHDRRELSAMVGAALAALEAAAVPMAALLAIFSPEIVVLLGGARYQAAAPVLAILAVALGISYVNGAFGNSLLALGRQTGLFWLMFGPLVVNLALNLALIPAIGIVGAALAVVASEVVAVVVIRAYYVKQFGPPDRPAHAKILAPGLLLGALAAVKFAFVPQAMPLLVVLLGGTLGLLLYTAALIRIGGLPAVVIDQLPSSLRMLRPASRR